MSMSLASLMLIGMGSALIGAGVTGIFLRMTFPAPHLRPERLKSGRASRGRRHV